MRILTTAALLALTIGCATGPRPQELAWDIVSADKGRPALVQGALALNGDCLRTQRTYAAPLTIEFDAECSEEGTNGTLYVEFVPAGAPGHELPSDYLAVQVINRQSVMAWVSRGNQPTLVLPASSLPKTTNGNYRVKLEAVGRELRIDVNGQSFHVSHGVPYEKFHVELRTLPPPSQWHVRNLVVR